jgi:hypothetical protein
MKTNYVGGGGFAKTNLLLNTLPYSIQASSRIAQWVNKAFMERSLSLSIGSESTTFLCGPHQRDGFGFDCESADHPFFLERKEPPIPGQFSIGMPPERDTTPISVISQSFDCFVTECSASH